MKIALAAARLKNRDILYNLSQISRYIHAAGQEGAELICFGESFLQGFDCLDWEYEKDRETAVSTDSPAFKQVCFLSEETGVDVLFGFVERQGEALYSACALVEKGVLTHCYRRVSQGWKEYNCTDAHYQEGAAAEIFRYRGKDCLLALCGDLWDCPEQFAQGEELLFWPVYISFPPEEWKGGVREEYARQGAKCCAKTLFVNSVADDDAYGGACLFENGAVSAELPMGKEGMLVVEV